MPDFDFKCSVQTQLDRLWLTPDDLAHALGVRPASVRTWLDPAVPDRLPAKEAFDWLMARSDELGDLVVKRLEQAREAHSRWGQAIVPYFSPNDLAEGQLLGLENLASNLVVDKLTEKGNDVAIVFASRDEAFIDARLDRLPAIDTKAEWAAEVDELGVTTLDFVRALDIEPRVVKEWRSPNPKKRLVPMPEAYEFLKAYAEALEGRTAQLIEQAPNPMPYHPVSRDGKLTQQARIDNRAAIAAADALMAETNRVIDFAYGEAIFEMDPEAPERDVRVPGRERGGMGAAQAPIRASVSERARGRSLIGRFTGEGPVGTGAADPLSHRHF